MSNIPERQRGSKCILQTSNELLSTEPIFYLQIRISVNTTVFLSTKYAGSTFYRVYIIPGRQRGSEMHFANLEMARMDCYLQNRIFIYRMDFYLHGRMKN